MGERMDEIKPDLVDELLKGYEKPEDIIGENGLLKRLTKALLERAMNAELTNHLGYEKHDPVGNNSGNSRNGTTSKTVKGDFGEDRGRDAARSQRNVRAADSGQTPDAFRRFRREDPVDVCAGYDDARDPGTPAGN